MKNLITSLVFAVLSFPTLAATQTVTLLIPSMTCPACPITVKKALSKVDGVSGSEISFDKRVAIVTFDDAKTNAKSLTKATEEAGYPSTVAKAK